MLRCKICGFVINSNDYATECPICHTAGWCDYYLTEIKKINADEKFVNAMMELREKDPLEFQIKMQQLGIQPFDNTASQNTSQSNQPRCPKCGSTAISTGARGVNYLWGFIGASKTVNRCSNCGYTWKPKR